MIIIAVIGGIWIIDWERLLLRIFLVMFMCESNEFKDWSSLFWRIWSFQNAFSTFNSTLHLHWSLNSQTVIIKQIFVVAAKSPQHIIKKFYCLILSVHWLQLFATPTLLPFFTVINALFPRFQLLHCSM